MSFLIPIICYEINYHNLKGGGTQKRDARNNMRILNRKGKAGMLIPIIVSAILALSYFAYMQFNTSTGYVIQSQLEPGTEITQELLNSGDVVIKQIPKDLITESTITDFNLIDGRYLKNTLTPGHIISAYDIAKTSDLRTNKDLVDMNLQAISIPVSPESGIPSTTKVGDRVNVFGVYTYEIANMIRNAAGEMENLTVATLPESLKTLYIANGYKEDSPLMNEQITVSKMLLQNVPVVSTESTEEGELQRVILGLESRHAELIHITMSTGKIGMSLLPFSEDGYAEEITDGVISTLELNINGTFKSGEILD